jgi:hypothetical protein
MNWDAIGAVGEIFGAIGVIITLAYLASQIRQNTRASKSEALQSLAESGASMNAMVVGDEEVARIFSAGLSDEYEQLNPIERTRFTFLIAQWILAYEAVYLQHGLGTVTDELFDSRMENLRMWLNTKGGRRAWENSKATFSKSYVAHVNAHVIIKV